MVVHAVSLLVFPGWLWVWTWLPTMLAGGRPVKLRAPIGGKLRCTEHNVSD